MGLEGGWMSNDTQKAFSHQRGGIQDDIDIVLALLLGSRSVTRRTDYDYPLHSVYRYKICIPNTAANYGDPPRKKP
jgi:hypothetical protein